MTSTEDVAEAIAKETGVPPEDVKVLNVRLGFASKQMATVLLSRATAKKLADKGRLRVGLVYARVREVPRLTRCFRCLEEGHETRQCKGEDRSKDCWRCGKSGHFARRCPASIMEAEEFKRVLARNKGAVAGGTQPQR